MRLGGILELSIPAHPTAQVGGALPQGSSGSLVTISVLKHLGANQWQVSLEGTRYQVSSTVRLLPGTVLKAQLFRSPTRILLKVLPLPAEGGRPPDAMGKLLASLGLPDDRLARLAVEALQQSGMSATREGTRSLRAALERSAGADSHLARLAALLMDRRLDLSQPFLDHLYRQIEGWLPGGEGEGSGRRGQRGDGGQGSDPEQGAGPRPEQGGILRDPPPTGLPLETDLDRWRALGQAERQGPLSRRIAAALRAQVGSSRPSVGPLTLFNHHPGHHDRWVILPFALKLGDREMRGSVRLLLGPDGSPGSFSVVVAGEGEHPRACFALTGGRTRRLAWYLDGLEGLSQGSRAAAQREAEALRENLRNLGIEVDDTMRDGDRFDGFSERRASTDPLDRTA